MPSTTFPRINNLEWLRLAFALQVVIEHGAGHLGVGLPGFIAHFPGVPAFFFVSGLLVYLSYQHAPGLRYAQNRFLRLFPGLLFVTLGGLAVVLLAHGGQDLWRNARTHATWVVAQVTLGQAYNPAAYRDVGVGVVNGALWTLTTEILFYMAVPVVAALQRRWRPALAVLMVSSFLLYAAGPAWWHEPLYRGKTLFDFLALTPLVWGWMFGFGILAAQHHEWLRRRERWLPWLAVPLVAMMLWGQGPVFQPSGNRLGLLYFACYAGLVWWVAFALPARPLATDLSYGTYVWHMPILNLLLVLGAASLPAMLLLTLAMAAVSWFCVERPALRRKHTSLHPAVGAKSARGRQ